jgi:hypothetical protein
VRCKLKFVGLKREGGVLVEMDSVVCTYESQDEYAEVKFDKQLLGVVAVRLELVSVLGILPGSLGFLAASVSVDDLEVVGRSV